MPKRFFPAFSTIGMVVLTYGMITALAVPSPLQTPENSDLSAKLPDGEGKEYVLTQCTVCHDLERIVSQKKSREAWQATVSEMLGRILPGMEDMQGSDQNAGIISQYLAAHFGVVTSPTLAQISSFLKDGDVPAAEILVRESAEPVGEELKKILMDMDRGFDELGRQKARYDILQQKFAQFEATWMPTQEVFRLFSRVVEQPDYFDHFQAKRLRIEGARHTTNADFLWDRQEYNEALEEYSEAIRKLRAAIPLAEAVGNQKLVAACLTNIGYAEIYSGNHTEGLKTYSQALKIAEQREDDVFQGMYLLNLGTFHLYTVQPQEALEFSLQAAEMNRTTGRRTWEANALLNTGAAYLFLRQKEEAHSYLQKALLKAEEAKDLRSHGRILYNLASVSAQFGGGAEAADLMEMALQWYSDYAIVYNQAELTMAQFRGFQFLTRQYQQLGNQEKVTYYRDQSKELLSENPQKLANYLADPHLNFYKWEEFKSRLAEERP